MNKVIVAIVGAALIGGGIVAYRTIKKKSKPAAPKAVRMTKADAFDIQCSELDGLVINIA